jgi:hypothetical protein
MKQPCPKCKSLNTYSDGLELACLMCGKRWPANGQESVVIKKNGRESVMEKSPSGKVGICINCEREKFIAGADGLCGTCHTAVKGLTPDTAAYKDILASVKIRITSKIDGRIGKKPEKKTLKPRILPPLPAATPRERADVILKKAIEILIPERDWHLSFAEKLTKAIEALQE